MDKQAARAAACKEIIELTEKAQNLGISIGSLCRESGTIYPSMVSKWKKGTHSPSSVNRQKIIDAFEKLMSKKGYHPTLF